MAIPSKPPGITREHLEKLNTAYWALSEWLKDYEIEAIALSDIYYFLESMLDAADKAGIRTIITPPSVVGEVQSGKSMPHEEMKPRGYRAKVSHRERIHRL